MLTFGLIILLSISSIYFGIDITTGEPSILSLYSYQVPNSIPCNKEETKSSNRFEHVINPHLIIFNPIKHDAKRTSVIICPGGSYRLLSFGFGNTIERVAKAFNSIGVTAFILKYRLPYDNECINKQNQSIVALQDLQQAILMVKENATKWNIDPDNVGVVGFSAGGHLVSTASTKFNINYVENPQRISLRPEFQVLIFPVISMQSGVTHKESKLNLLGENPSQELVDLFSSEKQVTGKTPPAFMVHGTNDNVVSVINSVRFYESLLSEGVKVEMHLLQDANHGFQFNSELLHQQWFQTLTHWLKLNQFIEADAIVKDALSQI